MITYVPDNLWGEMLPSMDNTRLMKDCLWAERYLLDCVVVDTPLLHYGSKTTASYSQYNLLTLPIESFQNLYHNIVTVIKPCLPDETYMIQCWLNVFRGNEFIDWHGHWNKKFRVVHGFYCCSVTPSFTEYQFEFGNVVKVNSVEGLLVFGNSNGDIHRSSPWTGFGPRITIAFDIVPVTTLPDDQKRPNHYLPF